MSSTICDAAESVIAAWDNACATERYDECRFEAFVKAGDVTPLRDAGRSTPMVAVIRDHACRIEINNNLDIELDKGMLAAVLARCALHVPNARKISIYPMPRVPLDAEPYKHPGWLEWGIHIDYTSGGRLYIGAIQRTIGAAYEFHT